ncbi:adenosine deaminase [Frondihabitans australicus]|uniref:Adenosine deaminase n=1 Tax=Frondihabitans australicus TaxID=386892 RepID=A0A495IIU4_9MICO|nr:adenosine deaminase [Frondihabitans australicus]RKR75026.1 adenosine deaminase [Frondihabitans australicus]
MTDTTLATEATEAAPVRDLAALPKGHLHIHWEAAIRKATLEEMGAAAGIEIDIPTEFDDFSFFSATYRSMLQVLSVEENLYRLFEETIEDCAREGVVYAEFGASPHFYAETFGSTEKALDVLIAKAAEIGAKHGVEVGLMITLDRTESIETAVAYATIAAAYAGRGVVSLGLANDERGYPAADFVEAFRIGKEAGLLSTPHAGELAGPSEVRAAVEILQADRVLHGVTSAEDPSLMQELAAKGICLDVCPTSNDLLGVVQTIHEHPLKVFLAAGVRCSINADDPVLFGPSILDEYETSRTVLGLSDDELAACARSSIECSGASAELKARALAGIDAWLA